MKLNFTKIRYVITIIQQREKFVSDLVIKGFTFIEMLISLFITLLILTVMPNLIRLTDTYLINAYEFDQSEYSFFQVDLNKMTNSKTITMKLINNHTIMIQRQHQNDYIKFHNHKIIFESNSKGNITLLNNVLYANFISRQRGIIEVILRIGNEVNYYDKTLFI